MTYKVIHYFTDLLDANYPYRAGDIFPRNGLKVSESRLMELSSSNNKQCKPLIQLVEESNQEEISEEVKETVKYTKTIINRMSTAELQELANKQGIKKANKMTGGELKKMLIDKLVL